LVIALSECVGHRKRRVARRFLQGLSADELRYIAEFLGSCILETPGRGECSRGQLADGIAHFERCRRAALPAATPHPNAVPLECSQNHEHKMILLLEYLCRSGLTQYSMAVKARQT
jgi:hypothetical protein